ncbi:prefoldin subunit 2-like [Trichosurus vulpecula]|uniref:prefoldin subunit 2-like n=1 Tax=Trichosurus vulpecula TaxID=9337 RepID=UPI00186B191B|nr:prefoldin subunit 2-like [Trichosurus vulpecula]
MLAFGLHLPHQTWCLLVIRTSSEDTQRLHVTSKKKQGWSSNRANKSSSSSSARSSGKGAVSASAEQVVAGLNRLRQEQRGLASKAAELEMELNEHSLVIDTVREVDPTRKCYPMVGGILVEQTVKEVLPALEGNKEQIQKIIETLIQQLTQAKGRELNDFTEKKHDIRLMGEDEKPAAKDNGEGSGVKASSAGVLVS